MARDHFSIGVYLTALVALADQATKWWAVETVREAHRSVKVTPFFNLTLSMNKGVTFGLLQHPGEWMPYLLVLVAVGVTLFLLRWLRHARTLSESLGLGLIMGGAIGNVIDRVRYGSVIDFADFHIGGWHWYTFNLADSAIVAGVALLLLDNFKLTRKKR